MPLSAQEISPGLWQGKWPPPGKWLAERGFATLVLCAAEFQPPNIVPLQVASLFQGTATPYPGVEILYAPNDDDFDNPPPRDTLRLAVQAARTVADRLSQRRKVLVTCWQGKNRSGLVSALSLHLAYGLSGEEATRIVQNRREKGLRNPQFCELLRHLPRKSTAPHASVY
jgi:protein-tyrosine phosphatase